MKPPPDRRSRLARAFGRFRTARKTAVARGSSGRGTGNILTLIRDVRQEIKKVEWPTREEATKLTAAVVGLSAIVGIFLGGVDFLFQEFFKIVISLGNGGI